MRGTPHPCRNTYSVPCWEHAHVHSAYAEQMHAQASARTCTCVCSVFCAVAVCPCLRSAKVSVFITANDLDLAKTVYRLAESWTRLHPYTSPAYHNGEEGRYLPVKVTCLM